MDVETRSVTSGLANPQGWLTDAWTSNRAPSGKRVTVQSALGLSPVWAAVSLIAEQVGQLPLKVYRRIDDPDADVQRVEARSHRAWRLLHDKPNSSTPADRFWSAVTAQLLLHGNAFVRKSRSDLFVVDELFLLDPAGVVIKYDPNTGEKRFVYRPSAGQPAVEYTDDEVLHIFGMSLDGVVGLSVIQTCKAALGAALARDAWEGEFYANGATLSGALKHPNKLSPDAAANLKASFDARYKGEGKRWGVPVFEEGMEYVKIGSALQDMQFVEAQNMSRTDVAVMFKLPPNYLGGSSGESLTYTTVESNQIQFALHAIAPWTNTIAKAVTNDPGLLPQNVFEAEFTLEAMMRGDAKSRADFYKLMHDMGAMTDDEIRAKENMPALTSEQRDQLAPASAPAPQLPSPDDAATQDNNGDSASGVVPMRAVR